MPSIRLMGFAAGALFLLASAADAQTPPVPGKSLPPPQGPGQAASGAAGTTSAAPTGYYGGGYPAGTAGYPAGTAGYPAGYPGGYDVGRPGYNPGGLGGPRSGLGVRPGLGVGGFGPGR